MRWVYRIFIGLVFLLAVLTVLGMVLPAPKLPDAGKMVSLDNGYKINVYEKGEGQRDIILVHGLPGSAQDFVELADALAAHGFHVYYYDRIGYGHSSRRKDGEAYTVQSNGKELDALIKSLGLKNPALVGWSFGGGTVLSSQAARNPETPFIVLLASIGPDMVVDNPKPPIGPFTKWLMRLPVLGKGGTEASIKKRFGDILPERWVKAQRGLLLAPNVIDTMNAEYLGLNPKDIKTAGIKAPVLIIHGDQDKMVPYIVGEGLVERIKGSTLATLKGVGHMLPLSHTKPVALAIEGFAKKS